MRPERDRADAAGRDLIVGERPPPRTIGIASRRIVDYRGRRTEVAGPERRLRDVGARDAAAVVIGPHVVAEEEQLVPPNRPAQREAALHVQRVGRGKQREGILRHRRFRVAEAEERAGSSRSSRISASCWSRAAGRPELRVVVAGDDGDGFDRLGRGNQERQAPAVIRAFQLDGYSGPAPGR